MANLIVKNPPEFTEQIHKTEKEEFITADLENEIKSALLNNEVFLKVLTETIQKTVEQHITNGVIHVTSKDKENWSGKAGTAVATQAADGLESAADKRKLDGIAEGAEVNQNAFSNIKVGNVTVSANGKTATFTLEAGSNVTINADNASKKIVITANRDGGNADKLDGYHAEHFAAKDHAHDYIPTDASCNKNWNWTEQKNQPIWVWGGDDMTNMYVYHPSRLHVEYAESAGAVAWNNVSGKPSSYPPSNHGHNDYLSTSGGTLAGNLNLQPPSGEGGQLELRAASSTPDITGIVLDTLNGDFRIFGIASKKITGVGSVLRINPYSKEFDARNYNGKFNSLTCFDQRNNLSFSGDLEERASSYEVSYDNITIGKDPMRFTYLNSYPPVPRDSGELTYNICIGGNQFAELSDGGDEYTRNVFIGYNLGGNRAYTSYTTGYMNDNVCVGHQSGANFTDGSCQNTCIGASSGITSTSQAQLGHGNTFIGYRSGSNQAGQTDYSTAIGYNARAEGDYQIQLGNTNDKVYLYGSIQNRSDQRDKTDIRDTHLGLDFLLKHRAVEFRWDFRADYKEEYMTEDGRISWKELPKDGSKSRKRFHQGFLAQEVKKVMDEMDTDFAGYEDVSINGGADALNISYMEYIPIIVKAIQQLKQMYDKEIKSLKEEIILLKSSLNEPVR